MTVDQIKETLKERLAESEIFLSDPVMIVTKEEIIEILIDEIGETVLQMDTSDIEDILDEGEDAVNNVDWEDLARDVIRREVYEYDDEYDDDYEEEEDED